MTLQHPACSSDGNNITTISLSNDYKAFWLYNKYFRCNVCKTNKRQKKKIIIPKLHFYKLSCN